MTPRAHSLRYNCRIAESDIRTEIDDSTVALPYVACNATCFCVPTKGSPINPQNRASLGNGIKFGGVDDWFFHFLFPNFALYFLWALAGTNITLFG